MTIADKALSAAINFEYKKVAYRQSKDGIVVSFVLHPQEVPAALSTSHIGARYIAVLVEIGDDEKPITQAEKENDRTPVRTAAQPQPAPKSAGATRKPWETLPPQQQAAMRADQAAFVSFLKESYPDEWHETTDANDCLKLICGVASKRDLEIDQRARVAWHQLDSHFIAWERVGA